MKLLNLWFGNPYGDATSLIVESEKEQGKNINYKEFWTNPEQLEQIANNIALYLKTFRSSYAGEEVAETSKTELLQQVAHRNGYKLARKESERADYEQRYKDSPNTKQRRLQLDPELVVTVQKQRVDKTIYWEAGLELYTQVGFIKSFATGNTEEEARSALNMKVENFISAICVPSKVEPEPPPTASAPVSPAPVPPAPVSAQQET
jgi:hypothetical protein